MNIWFFHHYAEPADGQFTASYDLAKHLVRRGHDVTVFASCLSHHTRTNLRTLTRWFGIEDCAGVRYVFVKTSPYHRNDWRRVRNMLEYSIRSLCVGWRLPDRPDVVVGSTPHPFAPLIAMTVARVKRASFVLELHDLWPQFLVEVGALSRYHPIVPMFQWIERICFRRASAIAALWPGMSRYVEEQGVSAGKVVWVPMGLDVSQRGPIPRTRRTGEPLVFMYRGGFGWANEIKVILDAAEVLQRTGHQHIRLVLAGDGTGKQAALDHARRLNLRNVEFRGFVPKAQLPAALAEADVLLCCLPGVRQFHRYGQIATKLLDYLSAGRPTILAADIPNNLIEQAKAGAVVAAGDAKALARAMVDLAGKTIEERLRMGANGLEYLKAHHDIANLAARFELALLNVGRGELPTRALPQVDN